MAQQGKCPTIKFTKIHAKKSCQQFKKSTQLQLEIKRFLGQQSEVLLEKEVDLNKDNHFRVGSIISLQKLTYVSTWILPHP